ncbi:hypothetical protein CHS0354_039010, partial [Potamilus streckersoni]
MSYALVDLSEKNKDGTNTLFLPNQNLISKAGWLSKFEKIKDEEDSIPALNDNIDFMFCDKTDLSSESATIPFHNHFINISYSKEQCAKIELGKRDQHTNNRWIAYGKGRIRRSRLGQVVMRKETTRQDNL